MGLPRSVANAWQATDGTPYRLMMQHLLGGHYSSPVGNAAVASNPELPARGPGVAVHIKSIGGSGALQKAAIDVSSQQCQLGSPVISADADSAWTPTKFQHAAYSLEWSGTPYVSGACARDTVSGSGHFGNGTISFGGSHGGVQFCHDDSLGGINPMGSWEVGLDESEGAYQLADPFIWPVERRTP